MSKKNIFAKFQDYVNKPKRNVFDLSFGNNLTTKFGQLTPVFCKECIPGDSFKIHSRFALQFMPMKFPVQTPMRAYLHFFYVRNRTLWKDWMDFIGKTKDNLTLPYVTPSDKKKFFRVGGLADYLGVPNVVYGNYGVSDTSEKMNYNTTATLDENWNGDYRLSLTGNNYFKYDVIEPIYQNLAANPDSTNLYGYSSLVSLIGTTYSDCVSSEVPANTFFAAVGSGSAPANTDRIKACPLMEIGSFDIDHNLNVQLDNPQTFTFKSQLIMNPTSSYGSWFAGDSGSSYATTNLDGYNVYCCYYDSNDKLLQVFPSTIYDYSVTTEDSDIFMNFKFDEHVFSNAQTLTDFSKLRVFMWSPMTTYTPTGESYIFMTSYFYDQVNSTLSMSYDLAADRVIGDGSLSSTPYDSDIHLNALPFRAYEAIYNSYYRNAQNNPFILNGVPEYNKYITTAEGGQDVTQYDLYQRNWEYDFLTSAVQTPQQGDIAPLVGISVTGEATFQDENGNTYYASAQYDSDGNITGWTSHSPNMPQGSLRLLMDMAGTGISINDLRNVNAFQKFLENNIRHGLKYRDQIKSHFGVDVRYDELDMPEFIGGCSTDVNINKLSQTSESGDTPLGSFVGQASAYGESKHDITHYCDEHGFIIGILSVVPVPVYSQLLPKYFVKNEQLDYYFPEFGHLGYQPILQKEVSPLQTFYAGDNLNAVFGYNRAWYDYLDSTDEVHAQFRTTMRDFIMNRTFDTAPELGEDFLLVDPDQLNDVFLAGTDDSGIYDAEADKIIGSMYFNVSKKSPIPLFGIPKLD